MENLLSHFNSLPTLALLAAGLLGTSTLCLWVMVEDL